MPSPTPKKYSFIIIGGGTAGLPLSALLSANPHLSILVLEAGAHHPTPTSPLVAIPGLYGHCFGQPTHDWSFTTVPQRALHHTVHRWPRGKMLGGSSGINLMMHSQCSARDLDNWVALGNPGWAYADLLPYFQRAETYTAPSEGLAQKLGYVPVDAGLRGGEGPVRGMWPVLGEAMGYPSPRDCREGTSLGLFNQPLGVGADGRRSYAVGYWEPVRERGNLEVRTGALVEKILFGKRKDGEAVTATGVQYVCDGERITVQVEEGGEVIVSAGAVQSPQILELSGLGNKEMLEKYGIELVVELSGVGENLRDHVVAPFSWEVKDGVPTSEAAAKPEVFAQLMELYKKTNGGPLANTVTTTGFLPYHSLATTLSTTDIEEHINEICPASMSPLDDLAKLQLIDENEAAVQVLFVSKGVDTAKMNTPRTGWGHNFPGAYGTILAATTRTFSRGSIHIMSADPTEHPEIDPAYLSHPLDVDILAQAILHFQEMARTDPLSGFLKKDADGANIPIPGMTAPKNLEEAKQHVHKHAFTEYHPIGTCSMLPKESGGVVDSDLKVYGTTNVRVCDASIFPMHVQGNIQSLVYAVAEKTADFLQRKK
ncbi:alcohol oxidase [Mytilinidion resinicola]|uniref:Alcohol oxidase n=1 Tax=Mytilinidion resinicola TaxID=574789 RepID=A0A6A6YVU7_9PEZI|nr:alcohol oxidase [Mytilinidion resinicola]KAF2812105.1 alcohol oxidase [Mytilinidion resinicola]